MVTAYRTKAQAFVTSQKEKYEKLTNDLSDRETAASRLEQRLSQRKACLDAEVEIAANAKIKDQIKSLEKEYGKKDEALIKAFKRDREKYFSILWISLGYSILVTLLMAFQTEVLRNDAVSFGKAVSGGVAAFFGEALKAAQFSAQVGNLIPNAIVSTALYWLVLIIVFAIIVGGVGVALFFAIRKYVRYFREKQADESTVFILLLDLAAVVFVGDITKAVVPINLIGLFLGVYVAYTVIRAFVEMEDTEQRSKFLGYGVIVAGCMAVVVLLVHLVGAVAILALPVGVVVAVGGQR